MGGHVHTIGSTSRELIEQHRWSECLIEIDIRGTILCKRPHLAFCHRQWRQQFEIRHAGRK